MYDLYCKAFTWADWSAWSQCSSSSSYGGYGKQKVKCGRIGTRVKTRVCHDENYCSKKTYELKGFCRQDPKMRKEESCPGDPCVGTLYTYRSISNTFIS